MLTVGTDMTHCFKECLMPLEIDNLSSFICKMSACQVVSRRQTTEDTAAHVSPLAATELQMRCGRADSPSLRGISNHLQALSSLRWTATWAPVADAWLMNLYSWQLALSEVLIPNRVDSGHFKLLRLLWFILGLGTRVSHFCNFETETGGCRFKAIYQDSK